MNSGNFRDALTDVASSPNYAGRLCRAVALVAVGAALHVPLPRGATLQVPAIDPLRLAFLEPHRGEPAVLVEQRTVVVREPAELGAQDPRPSRDVSSSAGLRDGRKRAVNLAGSTVSASSIVSSMDETSPVGTSGGAPAAERTAGEATGPANAAPPSLPGRTPDGSQDGSQEEGRAAEHSAASVVPAASKPELSAADPERREPVARAVRSSSPPVSEEELVRKLLDEYAGAFERLDVGAAKAVWPTVDRKALERAFAQLSAQRLTLQSCGITISGSTANARCRGSATYQPRIGSRAVQIAAREWTFDLSKQDTAWRIVHTLVR